MVLVDGYNYLYKHHRYETAEDLISAVSVYAQYYERKIILVFDGEWEYDGEYDTRWCEVLFVKDADMTIMSLAEQYPRSYVITSDRDIIQRVRQFKAKIIKSEKWTIELPGGGEDEKPSSVTDAEVAQYLDLFKEKDN